MKPPSEASSPLPILPSAYTGACTLPKPPDSTLGTAPALLRLFVRECAAPDLPPQPHPAAAVSTAHVPGPSANPDKESLGWCRANAVAVGCRDGVCVPAVCWEVAGSAAGSGGGETGEVRMLPGAVQGSHMDAEKPEA